MPDFLLICTFCVLRGTFPFHLSGDGCKTCTAMSFRIRVSLQPVSGRTGCEPGPPLSGTPAHHRAHTSLWTKETIQAFQTPRCWDIPALFINAWVIKSQASTQPLHVKQTKIESGNPETPDLTCGTVLSLCYSFCVSPYSRGLRGRLVLLSRVFSHRGEAGWPYRTG